MERECETIQGEIWRLEEDEKGKERYEKGIEEHKATKISLGNWCRDCKDWYSGTRCRCDGY